MIATTHMLRSVALAFRPPYTADHKTFAAVRAAKTSPVCGMSQRFVPITA
jgi:hypothetical protein